jgi:ectoine hydroxylase-related dioxygenase (phytanoyl-CoA dioxygenase family)
MNKWESNFHLGETLTQEQVDFFAKHGVIVFRNFISPEKVSVCLEEIKRLEKTWIEEKREKINGIPLKFGKDAFGNKTIQRLSFTSLYSPPLHDLLNDPRLIPLSGFLEPYEGRIAENEKDGLVVNNYLNTPNSGFSQMGWHTDSPRDLFLGQKIMPMLNVGIHLDECLFENGGLRLLPGTHQQGFLKLLF